MSIYTTEAILLGWHTSDGPQGHWVKFKLPLAITDGHPFALFVKGPEHGQRFRMTFEAIGNDELPTGHAIVGSAPSPSADAADSPAAAPMSPLHKAIAHLYEDGGSTEREAELYPSDPRPARQTLQAQARGATEPATKPKKHWDELKPSQQAGMMCDDKRFQYWAHVRVGKIQRWDGRTFDWDRDGYGTAAEHVGVLMVRWYCGVSSRSDLDTNPEAAKRWRELFGMFQADTQYGDRR